MASQHSQATQLTQLAGQDQNTPTEDEDDDVPPDQPWGRLVRFHPLLAQVDLVGDKPFVVGRNDHTQLVVQHPQVSNKHFSIRRDLRRGANCLIEDSSSNGTWVNSKRLIKAAPNELIHKSLISMVSSRPKATQLPFSFVFYDLVRGNTAHNDGPNGPDVIGNFYIADEVLGRGSFATVKLAYNMMDGAQVAVKVVSKRRFKEENKTKQNLLSEIMMLQKLKHPGVVNIFDVEDTVHCVYIFLEYAPDGDLFQFIKKNGPLPEKTAKIYFKQILLAVEYLHKESIIHRDLKLENVVLLPRKPYHLVKITDFGLAKLLGEAPFVKTICGTPNYIAPEILLSRAYDQKVDCWSLGVILYTMLTAAMPFDEKEEQVLYKKIVMGNFEMRPQDWETLHPSACDLVKALITVDPVKRLSVQQALAHPWLNDDGEIADIVQHIMESQPQVIDAPTTSKDEESLVDGVNGLKRKHESSGLAGPAGAASVDGTPSSSSKSPRVNDGTSSNPGANPLQTSSEQVV